MVKSALIACAALLAACRPEIEGRPSLIESPRVVAIRSDPADGKPQSPVRYTSLYVGPDGTLGGDDLDWGLCQQRKALTQPGSIAAACLEPQSDALQALGTGSTVTGTILKDACSLFGPTPPAPKPGEPSVRPVDPDTTGGYYQVVRVADDEAYSVGVTRVACGLGGATQAQSSDFTKRNRLNENPTFAQLTVRRADGGEQTATPAESDAGEPIAVTRGERLQLTAAWPACPTEDSCGDGICGPNEDNTPGGCPDDCRDPRGCAGAEPYVYFDPQRRSLTDRREAVRVSWFASAGSFDHERTGRAETETEHDTTNAWTAPEQSATVWLWLVIRDDRGGTGWSSYQLQVN